MTKSQGEHITTFYEYHTSASAGHFTLGQRLEQLQRIDKRVVGLREEYCYYVASREPLTREERRQILWLLEPAGEQSMEVSVSELDSRLRQDYVANEELKSVTAAAKYLVEVGPRLNFNSPFSTNAVSILRSSCPNTSVYRLERSTIYLIEIEKERTVSDDVHKNLLNQLAEVLYDKMVEMVYESPVTSFHPDAPRALIAQGEPELQPCAQVDIMGRGEVALREVSSKLGLFFDDWDINYYVTLFRDTIKRNPTVVECFDLAQSNSEHSRHWFFKGILDIKGRMPSQKSLIDMVAGTQKSSNPNNVIKFEDNSSAIEGFTNLSLLKPRQVGCCSQMQVTPANQSRHIIFTAETHNFPTGVAPFPGAATGTGGRIRDVQATGRGAHVIAGTAGYSFGNLLLEDYELDWENPHELYPNNLAHPARVAVEASNGASDYGNKFGEPIVCGFARSFGMRLTASNATAKQRKTERWEYLKPIMFRGGVGSIDATMTQKLKPEPGMKVAKLGGPVYRIGIGGGAASSASGVEGKDQDDDQDQDQDDKSTLNFNAVQRGDPEMEQKLNRIIRACIENNPSETIDELGTEWNPIYSIHDQGAGGNGNVLKEIVDPLGAIIDANAFTLGDHTVNILELWAAEYQESNAVLLFNSNKSRELLARVAKREKCAVDFVGDVEASGTIKLKNFDDTKNNNSSSKAEQEKFPINLKLEHVIGSMPRKVFNLLDYSLDEFLSPAQLMQAEEPPKTMKSIKRRIMREQMYILQQHQMMTNFDHLLEKVMKLPSVGSKRYLTTKVDRCVTGLIAGQQCLGPLHTPISDYALVALSHFEKCGTVTSIGEQPIKGLVSPISNATMSVAEAITNMMFCVITSLKDVKCSANWMWAAKLPGEGAKLLDACEAMCRLMGELGIAVDGGKDSLSMSASVDPKNARKLLQPQPATQETTLDSDIGKIESPAEVCDNDDDEDENDDDDDATVETVKSPGTLVISAYAPVPDINCKVTPILKCRPKLSHLIYVNLAHPIDDLQHCGHVNKFRLGGSAILQTLGQIGDEAPTIDHPELLRDGFQLIQELIKERTCTAGHDVSDGGLIVCALEMALASHCGINLNIHAVGAFKDLGCANNEEKVLGALFSEECAVVIEVEAAGEQELSAILTRFEALNIAAQRIGFGSYENPRVTVKFEQQLLLEYADNSVLRDYWESTSCQLDRRQANKSCVQEEYQQLSKRPNKPHWKLSFDPNETKLVAPNNFDQHYLKQQQPKVAVLREEGINGDREMMASLAMAGFEVFDLTVTDLTHKSSVGADLNSFDGLVFPGGFSYADVFGSGRGWAATLIFNPEIRTQLETFRRRKNTFSLGVCNGCQLMSLLGFLEDLPNSNKSNKLIEVPETTVRLTHNDSGRFECRFVNVCIEATTNSIMLRDMEESRLGVWVAHGEGKFVIEQSVEVDSEPRIAMRYVDDKGEPTMQYPLNPNGSEHSVAALCSRDGRHLAMMPHPERCTQMWQWPYVPEEWTQEEEKEEGERVGENDDAAAAAAAAAKEATSTKAIKISPWMQMFVNAYEFCQQKSE